MIRQPVMLSLVVAAAMAATSPAMANPARDRAVLAQARGELRAAQIEWRNAVRAEPTVGAIRAGLASASLDIGDVDTAEREARAALANGYDRAAGTALLMRVLLSQGRFRDVLSEFPEPAPDLPPAVALQVAAGRALAQIGSGDVEGARASVATAERLNGASMEAGVAAASLAMTEGDKAAAEARIDRTLAAHPNAREALLIKAQLQLERNDPTGALENFGRIVSTAPGEVTARLRRAEVLLRMGQVDRAAPDIDAVSASVPNNAMAVYLRAMAFSLQQNWRAADATLQRLGPQVAAFPDGLLMQAMAKRGLGQTAQAEDAARRHVARFPDDPRGARLLGSMALDGGRPEEAVAVLARATQREPRDPELYELLGRAYSTVGRSAEAVQALEKAVSIAPDNPTLLTRLGIARLAVGDAEGAQNAVREALKHGPALPGAREMLVATAMSRGDLATAETELAGLPADTRRGEVASSLAGTLSLMRLDLPAARTEFENAIRQAPASKIGRLGLARVALLQDRGEEAIRLVAEVLRQDPANAEAIRRMSELTTGAAGPAALTALVAEQAASPAQPALAITTAEALARNGQADRAIAILGGDALRQGRGTAIPLARSEIQAAAGQAARAEESAREALAEDPSSARARVQLARLRMRANDPREAEALLREGLRAAPGDAMLQQALMGLITENRGVDAALAEATQLASQADALPAAATLRGDVLMAAHRPAEAAQAFAALTPSSPSGPLALRLSAALQAAGQPDQAAAALRARVEAVPDDVEVLNALAQFDIVAGRIAEAEARLRQLIAIAPEHPMALNNLAWLLGERGDPDSLVQARGFAQRAFYLAPNPDTADTLGWILARGPDHGLAITLLRQGGDRAGTAYRLAYALQKAGERQEALRVLTPVLATDTTFPERSQAERLRAELQP
nr:XrtA/PEP-CTERM system TPR-repeat protein PrsT [uncultured Roseococcus sp.]